MKSRRQDLTSAILYFADATPPPPSARHWVRRCEMKNFQKFEGLMCTDRVSRTIAWAGFRGLRELLFQDFHAATNDRKARRVLMTRDR